MRRGRLVLASFLLGLCLCEAGLRLAWHNPFRSEAPDRIVRLRLHHARTDHVLDRSQIYGPGPATRLRTDSRSYLLPSFQHEAPDFTIAFLGGSTTEGSATLEELRIHALVSELLLEKGLKVNTLNAARSANTIHDSLNVLLNHVVNDHPDVVVLMHAINDVGLLAERPGYEERMGREVGLVDFVRWGVQSASSRSYLAALVRRAASGRPLKGGAEAIRRQGDEREHLAASPEPYRQRLVGFVRLSRAFGIEPVLMTEPLSGARTELTPYWMNASAQDAFNQIIRDVGEEESALVIDLVRYLRSEVAGWDEPMKVFYDGMHFTDFGSRQVAGHIAERVYAEILKRRLPPHPPQRGSPSPAAGRPISPRS